MHSLMVLKKSNAELQHDQLLMVDAPLDVDKKFREREVEKYIVVVSKMVQSAIDDFFLIFQIYFTYINFFY
jgi:hypothetical protein